MIIECTNFILRPWQDSDIPELVRLANNRKIFENVRDHFPSPYTYRDAVQWLEFVKQNKEPLRLFAIETEGRLAGSISIEFKTDVYRKNAEIGYWLGEPYWNRHIMTEAIKCITRYIFDQFAIVRIYAESFADNAGSRRALEKAGFVCEAVHRSNIIKNNKIKDSCIYALLKKDWSAREESP